MNIKARTRLRNTFRSKEFGLFIIWIAFILIFSLIATNYFKPGTIRTIL
jgi:hypothetical protein